MEVQQDFKELLELFNARKVEYMIVGAHALAFHGAPRYTGDLHILIRADEENARRVMIALEDFGFGSVGVEMNDFVRRDKVVQLGVQPVRIDIITSISGVSWEKAAAGAVKGKYGGTPVRYIGKEDFIENKRAIGRLRDLADIEALEKK
jgi:hypothetical protein